MIILVTRLLSSGCSKSGVSSRCRCGRSCRCGRNCSSRIISRIIIDTSSTSSSNNNSSNSSGGSSGKGGGGGGSSYFHGIALMTEMHMFGRSGKQGNAE